MSLLNRSNLHEYQEVAVQKILDNPAYALFLQMGLGKTAISICAIEELIKDLAVTKVLIVAPLRVCINTWPEEITKWSDELTFTQLAGLLTPKRIKNLKENTDIYIINRELIPWLVEKFGKFWPFDMVIIDESSSFKNPKSKRFKALKKVRGKINRIVELTGSPAPNGLLDIYSPIWLLDFGERLGRTMTTFKNQYFTSDYMGWKWELRKGAEEKIYKNISDITLSMKALDHIHLPDVIYNNIEIDLPKKAQKIYQELEKELYVELSEEENITALTAAALSNKCLQLANGTVYIEEGESDIHDEKIKALENIKEEAEGNPILVAYNFKTDLKKIQAKFPKAKVLDKDPQTVKDWNEGKIDMLIAHPACLSADTEVLTEFRGWINITGVEDDERVFDGVEFVSHEGCHYSGYKEVTDFNGITATPEHKILINNKWMEVKDVRDSEDLGEKARYAYKGNDKYLIEMCSVRSYSEDTSTKCKETQSSWSKVLSALCNRQLSSHDRNLFLEYLARYAMEVQQFIRQKLWWSRNILRSRVGKFREFLQRYVGHIRGWFNYRARGCQQGLFQRELCLDPNVQSECQQTYYPKTNLPRKRNTSCRAGQIDRNRQDDVVSSIEQGYECRRSSPRCDEQQLFKAEQKTRNLFRFVNNKPTIQNSKCISKHSIKTSEVRKNRESYKKEHVYDLVNCGKRHRFLIRNKQGEMFVSHNSAAYGLNLQKGGSIICWYGLNWSLELYEQFNARLHRQGQESTVFIHHIVAKDTIDEKVLDVVKGKATIQEALFSATKYKDAA